MNSKPDLTRTVLAILFIGGLILASFLVLQPFLGATIWAGMIVISTWSLMLGVQRRLWNRRWLAVLVMTVAALLVFVVPLALAVGTIVSNTDRIEGWVHSLTEKGVPPPPAWVANVPMVGSKIAATWQEISAGGKPYLEDHIGPYLLAAMHWLAGQAGNFGSLLLQFLLTVVIAAIFYSSGEKTAGGIRAFARRLAGARGEEVVGLAAQSIRGVALGVVVTAVVQALLGGIGLAVAGIPAAVLLTAAMFVLCVAQIGAGLVLVPAVVWLYWSGNTTMGTVLLVWTVFVLSIDNFLRPMLIRRGADLPLVLVFAGVIGGLLSLGLVGIFVGPVVLAVTFTLLKAWVADAPDPAIEARA
jgi:predicted PurR-regulated permease PerM